jgi:chromodomain-helicase-DNA-binding protein 1
LQLNVVVYVGDSCSREVIRTFEWHADHHTASKTRQWRFEVILTTYELVLKDAKVLSQVKWSYLMVDEAHRLKNSESALYQVKSGLGQKQGGG